MKFEVDLDTTEASPEELVEAIKASLAVLDLPNGDKMYLDSDAITVTSKD